METCDCESCRNTRLIDRLSALVKKTAAERDELQERLDAVQAQLDAATMSKQDRADWENKYAKENL